MFAVLLVPDFALQCALRREPDLRACALAVTDGALPARVRQMTEPARAAGVTAGMTTTQALGRCPSLLFRVPGSLDAESACLLQCAERFSPWLEATGEGVVTFELRIGHATPASQSSVILRAAKDPSDTPPSTAGRSFAACRMTRSMVAEGPAAVGDQNGEPATLPGRSSSTSSPLRVSATQRMADRADDAWPAQLLQHLAACGFTAQIGLAATPDLALLAAHCAQPVRQVESARDFLSTLPLEVLAADPDAQAATAEAAKMRAERAATFRLLQRWGLHTLGALAALPREDVVSRLGPAAAVLWDRASGKAERPLRLVRVPEIFAEAQELEHELETLEPLLFLLRHFAERLTARLAAAYRVAASLTLTLRFAEGEPHMRELRIPAPTGDVDLLFRVLSTHLEGVTAASPIVAVELCAQATRAEQKQFGLFESGLRDPHKFYETLARLHALLGDGRAGTPVAEDTHRPDAFKMTTPRFDDSSAAAALEPAPGLPLQRFRPPLEAKVQAVGGRPCHVFSDKAFGAITVCRGPWIGSGEWWGGGAWERVEWDVQVGDRLYRLAEEGGQWFVDGAYD